MRRAARLVVLYVLEAFAVVLALVILAGGALLWRLAEGPLDADILRPTLVGALADAVDGDTATVGRIQARFDPATAALIFIASDVRVERSPGDVVLAAEELSTGLALDLLLTGRARPVSIRARGGNFSVVRTSEGRVLAGFGDPRQLNRETDASSQPGSGLGSFTRELNRSGSGVLSRLQRLELSQVYLRLVDESIELDWLIDDVALDFDLQDEQVRGAMTGQLVTSAGPAPLSLQIESARNLNSVFAEFQVSDLVPAAAAPRRGLFAPLSGLEAQFNGRLVFDATAQDGLRTVLVDIRSGAGEVRAAGETVVFDENAVLLEYDALSGAIELNQFQIQSDLLQLNITGQIYDLGNYVGALPTEARFELTSDAGLYNPVGVFPDAQAWDEVVAAGRIDTQSQELIFEQLDIRLPYATGRLTGRLALESIEGRQLPSLAFAGPIEGEIGKDQVLRHWPVNFALGARDWVRDSILAGRLSGAELDLNIPASAIAERALSDDNLSLSFGFTDAQVRYVSTMTPLVGLSGQAQLRGNSLSLTGQNGMIGALNIDRVFVEIPRLNPKGAIARFGGAGTGEVGPVLALLSQPPLELSEDYGLDPAMFSGRGEMTFEIRRPMRRFVPVENIGFQIDGRFEDVTAPTGVDGVDLEEGTVTISANEDGLSANGTARLARSQITIDWTETFGLDDGDPSTQVLASGIMSARALDQLGLPARRFMDGAVGVEAELVGRGFDFASVSVGLDLAEATVVLPAEIWEKPAGAPGQAQLGIQFGDDGALNLNPLSITAEGIDLAATASVGADGRLVAADIERLIAPGQLDLSLIADRPEGLDGPLRLAFRGDYLNVGDLFTLTAPGGPGPLITAPLIVEADLNRVILRDVVFADLTLSALMGPDGIGNVGLMASNTAGETGLLVDYAPDPDNADQRLLTVRSDDAGSLLTAFGDFTNVAGGRLRLDAVAPNNGEAGLLSGRVEVDAFTLERMPLLARILAAGSLEGLGGLLSGEGIEFERLESDFTWSGGTLGLEDARAVGPSLGATTQGVVSFEESRIQLDGTLLPSYGANSILGGLPLIGELLTSRRGEGIFGVTFSVAGPFDETRVIANPLAAFAPGVFRRVFEGTEAERELDALRDRQREAEAAAQAEAQTPSSQDTEPPTQTEPAPNDPPAGDEADG